MRFVSKLLVLMLGIIIVVAIPASYITYTTNVNALKAQIRDSHEEIAFYAIDRIDRFLFDRLTDIRVLASDSIISSKDSSPDNIAERLIEFKNQKRVYFSLSFFDLNRTRIADTAGELFGEQYESSGYWTELRHGKISAASDISVAKQSKEPLINFASPVNGGNGVIGYVVARVAVSKLYNVTIPQSILQEKEEKIEIELLDKDGLLLFSNDKSAKILTKDEEGFKLFRERGSARLYNTITSVGGEEMIYSFAKEPGFLDFEGNGWLIILKQPAKIAFHTANLLRNIIFFILLFQIAISVLIASLLARSVTIPVSELYKAVKQVQDGNYRVRVNVKTGDELEEMANTLNSAIEVLQKLDENRKEIDMAKTEFLSITSHELRSPMTPIMAQIQMVLQNYYGRVNKKQTESLEIVLRNIKRLDKIIQDLLEISRIEAARLKFNFSHANLREHIQGLVVEMKSFMPEKNIQIETKIEKLPIIECDPERSMQVLRNLIDNAKKFSSRNSIITVTGQVRGNELLFSVRDRGIGIPAKNQLRIFEPFYQGEQGFSRSYGGTGLGLAICRGIVEAQNGRIWFESETGKGTIFYFTIPLRPLRESKSIRFLFSRQVHIENAVKNLLVEFIGLLGDSEFDMLRRRGLTYESVSELIEEFKDAKVIEKDIYESMKEQFIRLFKVNEKSDKLRRLKETFSSFLGTLGDKEFEEIKDPHNEDGVMGHIQKLEHDKILTKEKLNEFRKQIKSIFNS